MSIKQKLIDRFKRLPNDFTFDELVRLFTLFGYKLDNKGATSGSRVCFRKGASCYIFHRPHPGNTLKRGILSDIMNYFKLNGLL